MPKKTKATIPKLLISIAIDLIGMSSIALNIIPVLGTFLATMTDLITGPLTAVWIKVAFTKHSTLLAMIAVIEEVTFFDIIPTATIAWCVERWS